MHDASKMLQIYVCYSHASLLSKEDKTTPKAWRRRHQWIAWRRVVAAEWFRASYCKTHILLLLLRRPANVHRFLAPRSSHLHCVERVRVVHRELVVAGLPKLRKSSQRVTCRERRMQRRASHLQQHLLHVVFIAHLKILHAGNSHAPLEIQAVTAGAAVSGNRQTNAMFFSKDGATESAGSGAGREGTYAPRASLHFGGLLMSTAVLSALPARYLRATSPTNNDAMANPKRNAVAIAKGIGL